MPESTIPPQVPKQSATGAWLVLGLIGLGLLGGGVYAVTKFNAAAKESNTAAALPTQQGASAQANALPAPPPPPPPLPAAEPVASQPALASVQARSTAAPKATGTGQVGRCSSPCNGDTDRAFEGALRQQGQLARRCYDLALRQNSALQGKLTVAVRVASDGRACNASITADGLGNPSISACVTKIFESATYPAPRGGCADAQVPLNFVPKQ